MSHADVILKLAETKRALAEKCENLAKLAGSQPKRKKLLHSAEKYRRQAEHLSRK